MPRTNIEIVSSFSGKISTGKFENTSPFFSIKETWSDLTDDQIKERQKQLEEMCYDRFKEAENAAIVDKINQERKDIRFYARNGAQYPSVTSVIGWDQDFFMPPAQLQQYAARGTILHKQVEIFLLTNEWVDPKDIAECYAEYIIVMKGDLQLKLDDVDFRGFYAKYPFKAIETERILFNDEFRYAGRCDIIANIDGKLTIIDLKTGQVNPEKAFKQLAAYAKCLITCPEQMMVVPLTNKTKQGFSQPLISNKVEESFQLFCKDRSAFRDRFSI